MSLRRGGCVGSPMGIDRRSWMSVTATTRPPKPTPSISLRSWPRNRSTGTFESVRRGNTRSGTRRRSWLWPGHVAKYLDAQGVTVVGIDLSPEMVRCAASRNPGLEFRVGDIRALSVPGGSLVGLVAFSSIVHFESAELDGVMSEFRRVLTLGGLALVSFHVGNQVVHLENLFGAPVDLDSWFHAPSTVIEALRAEQFAVIEQVEREPYEGVEYPSRRCYLFARAV
jgi:SAM-dependent methyltransferase